MQAIIRQLLAHQPLSAQDCERMFIEMEQASPLKTASLLTLLAAKGEALPEILAGRAFLLKQAQFHAPLANQCPESCIDLVGTGGDYANTFNISTAASLVVASCGVTVAKHGGGSSTSASGSADVISALKIPLSNTPEKALTHLQKMHFAFLRAADFNPYLKNIAPIRKQLPFPTLFNILGPLVHPLQPKRQVIGVYRKDLLPVIATLLQKTGSIHALVVHAAIGLDELSVHCNNEVIEIVQGQARSFTLSPKDLGFKSCRMDELAGGTPEENALVIQAIFQGKECGAKRDIVLLNAAAGLLVADAVSNMHEGVEMAREAIASGKTNRFLHMLQEGM